jgi:hypothetical protein
MSVEFNLKKLRLNGISGKFKIQPALFICISEIA